MYIRHRSVWTIPFRHTWSWIFRKIMDLRLHIRRYVCVSVGDGTNTNAWEDNWLHCGPLSAYLSYRYLCGNGLDHSANVHDMIDVIGNAWPTERVSCHQNLSNVVVPSDEFGRMEGFTWCVASFFGIHCLVLSYWPLPDCGLA